MLRRVAASGLGWGLAAFIMVWPVRSGIDNGTLVDLHAAATESKSGDRPVVKAQRDERTKPPAQTAALDPAQPPPVPPLPPVAEPFGLATVPIASGDVVAKWNGVETQIRAGNQILARCRDDTARCPGAARHFLAIVAQGRALSGRARIGIINRAVNMAIEPMSDLAQWGVPDRWSAPLETFTTGRGDCEDYAIAKYVALTAAGVPAPDIKLVVVRNTAANEDHAVVAVRNDDEWTILDNRWLMLVKDADMPKAIPLFVLDGTGVRRFTAPAVAVAQKTAAPASFDERGLSNAPRDLGNNHFDSAS